MQAVRLTGTIATGALVLALSGCGSNPQFNINSANRTYDALNTLYTVLARAELGALASRSSYGATVDDYATVIAGFEAGGLLKSAGRHAAGSRKRARLDSLNARVDDCIAQVNGLAAAHRKAGIPAQSPLIAATRASCTEAAREVANNENSALLVSTVAGDL